MDMKEQILEAIEAFGKDLHEKVTTLVSSQLFTVNEKVKQLDEEKSKIFHSVVAKLLCIMKRSGTDLETAISFFFRRVSKIDVDE